MTIDRDPNHLHPSARAMMERLHAKVERRLGIRLTCIETFRPGDVQEEAYTAGLTEKHAGGSHHNITLPNGDPASCAWHSAIDPHGPLIVGFGTSLLHPPATRTALVDTGRHGFKPLAPEEMIYFAVGLIGEELGLTGGFRWSVRGRGPDWTHWQISAPLSHIVAQLQAGRMLA
jgi:hypothetical protein